MKGLGVIEYSGLAKVLTIMDIWIKTHPEEYGGCPRMAKMLLNN